MKTNISANNKTRIYKPHHREQFTVEEDLQLVNLVLLYGEDRWELIESMMPMRNIRQCKERWYNYLSPSINNEPFSLDEDKQLMNLHQKYGTQWRKISTYFKGRTSIALRNRVSLLKRRISKFDFMQLHLFNESTKKNQKNKGKGITRHEKLSFQFNVDKNEQQVEDCENQQTFPDIVGDDNLFAEFNIDENESAFF